MSWLRLIIATLVSGTVISFTDWFFFGVLFHSAYGAYPEVWRASQAGNRGIWIALGFVTSLIFIYGCARLRRYRFAEAFMIAFWMWLVVALPIIATNAMFIKLDPLVVVAHSLGWLVRLGVASAFARFVRP